MTLPLPTMPPNPAVNLSDSSGLEMWGRLAAAISHRFLQTQVRLDFQDSAEYSGLVLRVGGGVHREIKSARLKYR
jgi:hypothetical protein